MRSDQWSIATALLGLLCLAMICFSAYCVAVAIENYQDGRQAADEAETVLRSTDHGQRQQLIDAIDDLTAILAITTTYGVYVPPIEVYWIQEFGK